MHLFSQTLMYRSSLNVYLIGSPRPTQYLIFIVQTFSKREIRMWWIHQENKELFEFSKIYNFLSKECQLWQDFYCMMIAHIRCNASQNCNPNCNAIRRTAMYSSRATYYMCSDPVAGYKSGLKYLLYKTRCF